MNEQGKTKVMQDMGEFSLAFFHVNAMRTHFKFLRDRKTDGLSKMHMQTWYAAKKQMPDGVPFFCCAIQSLPANSKSGTTFKILGIISCYDDYKIAEGVSKNWLNKHKWLETEEQKLAWTKEFLSGLKEWHGDDGDFSNINYEKFMEVAQ